MYRVKKFVNFLMPSVMGYSSTKYVHVFALNSCQSFGQIVPHSMYGEAVII